MIVLLGPTGCGKTTVSKELEKLGCIILPTYTTRNPRPNDDYTECISIEEFNTMKENKQFITTHDFDSITGKRLYGIPTIEAYNKPSIKSTQPYVIIGAYDYLKDIQSYAKHNKVKKVYAVFIDVDDETIIEKVLNDSGRGMDSNDVKARLVRDRGVNIKSKNIANSVIFNFKMRLSPTDLADIILNDYKVFF